jgi:hypothetical protein
MHPADKATRQFSRVDRVRFLLLMHQPALRGLDGRQLAAGGRVQMRVRTLIAVIPPRFREWRTGVSLLFAMGTKGSVTLRASRWG